MIRRWLAHDLAHDLALFAHFSWEAFIGQLHFGPKGDLLVDHESILLGI